MKPKVKVEITDEKGGKITLMMSGNYDPEKIQKLMQVLSQDAEPQNPTQDERGTLIDLLYEAVQFFGERWFDSKSAKELLEQRYGKNVSLPLVSTYLSRMKDGGRLLSRGNRVHREYHLT
ncbi:MAG: hypothetical protein ACP5TI_05400 [Thermoprotei archaeon]